MKFYDDLPKVEVSQLKKDLTKIKKDSRKLVQDLIMVMGYEGFVGLLDIYSKEEDVLERKEVEKDLIEVAYDILRHAK